MTSKSDEPTLADELREMGQQLKDLVRATAEHPTTKELEEKIARGVKEMSAEIDRARARAKATETAQAAGAELKKRAQTLKDSGAKEEIERGLATSVRGLNEQIRRAIAEIKKK
ncbi:MAG: hypothetical protein HY070_06505 [Chloroflexi bacterium]|nr:hypothetical protein [Chloroflexota bacterium]